MHLNPLHHKMVMKIVFETVTPVSVGVSGQEMLREILKVGEKPLIPATTWKGAFRAIAEKLAKTMSLQGVEELAVKLYRETEKGISYTPLDHDEEWERFYEEFEDAINNKQSPTPKYGLKTEKIKQFINDTYVDEEEARINSKDTAERYLASHCPIGRLFGNPVLAGKVRFIDTVLDVKKTHLRPGIGIDRKTGKVRENVLYYVESISSCTEITLRLVADNLLLRETDTTLFNNTLDYIQKLGIQIGTRKTTGMGLLTVKDIQRQDINLMSDTNLRIIKPWDAT